VLPFWQLTSEQDWKLCENNQLGIMSSVYKPGPLSEKKEAGLEKYIQWYLKNLIQQ
jgi:phenylpropionate dioxygenase-like ring-hydroxylating dioxygenase large terminal subunit